MESQRRILTRIAATGQHEPHLAGVEAFVERVLALTDDERKVVAERRRILDEAFREKAVRAGLEAAAAHPALYVSARARMAGAHLPTALAEGGRDRELTEVARLVELAIDEGLLAFVGQRTLHPNHLRELIAPWPV